MCATNPGITLQKAEFKATYSDGTLIGDSNGIFRSDENGEVRISDLKPDKTVIVTEVTVPPGFTKDTQSQIIKLSDYDKPSNLGVPITKRGNAQVLASNLLTSSNYSFSLNVIPMQTGEYVTDIYFDFGVDFQSTTGPP